MSNPTGSIFLSANQNYVWQDGDIYQIPQTDTVEAAAPAASFGGLGVANQPHQILLNKLNQIHSKQLIDESLLTLLGSLIFKSTVGLNGAGQFVGGTNPNGLDGSLTVGSTDQSAGIIQLIIQWNWTSLAPWFELTENTAQYPDIPNPFPITFAVPYQHQVFVILPYLTCTPSFIRHGTGWTFTPILPLQLTTNLLVLTTNTTTGNSAEDLLGEDRKSVV